ncbi:MAG: hypothetical protein H0V66_07575 [Bdellovibrionales bacterium]|nr:hypothetical protein [Bdellovibrionales bacterium]
MNFLKTSLLVASLSSLILISGCSDLFQKDVVDKTLGTNRFKANCELNIDEFSLILEEPIGEAIDCLGKNLKLFITAVESKRPGYLSRKSLMSYIKRNRKDIKPEVLNALQSVFDINFLVYGEDRDYISAANVDALVKVAKIFNDQASKVFKPVFMDTNTVEYDNYRHNRDQRIKPAALIISSALRDIFKANRTGGRVDQLNLNGMLDAFTTVNNEASISKVKQLLFAKKIILGGDKEELTHEELGRLVENFSSYVLIALDAIRYKDIRLNQESMIHFLNSDLELLNSLIYGGSMGDRSKEVFFTLNEVIDAVSLFSDDLDLGKYYDLLKEAKVIVMGGTQKETITGADFRRLFNHGFNLLKTGTLFHRFWSTERILLEARPGRPITYDFKNLYDLFGSEKKRVDDFVRILKNYRFLKGENISAFYTDDYMRNSNAVFEVAMYEYALTLVMKEFGCPKNTLKGTVACDGVPVLNGVYMKKEHVVDLVQKFRKVLIETGMILPGREVKTAETITLLGSLFQYQSDENKVFDVNEATEFAISLFTSIDVSKDLNAHFTKLNADKKCVMDNFKNRRISPECFKKHYFEGVCLNYPDQFPKLFASLGATVYENDPNRPGSKKLVCKIPLDSPNMAYLDRAIKAARTCNVFPNTDEEIFYSKGDTMSVFLAMMHIETTIIRWDTRKHNNVMDPAEVMDAYNIYSPALDGFLEKMPGVVKKLKKQIYQYMVKYERVPNDKEFSSIWKFLKFLVSFDKSATANRKTIASILVTIGEQGTPSLFDCSLLRNPDTIPEDYDPTKEKVVTEVVPPTPLVLTRGDMELAQDIEKQPDSWIKWFLNLNWPDLF